MNLGLLEDPALVSQRNGTGVREALPRWSVLLIITFVETVVKTVAKRTGLQETDLGS